VVGQLSGVVDASVQFYWDILTEDTPAEGSQLHFRHTVMEMECRECGTTFIPEEPVFICTACGSPSVKVIAGDEFRLEAIDLKPTDGSGELESDR